MGGPTNLLSFSRLNRGRATKPYSSCARGFDSAVNREPPLPGELAYLLL
jgi:hypothetical protein